MKTFICLDCDHAFSVYTDQSCPECGSEDTECIDDDQYEDDGHYEGDFAHLDITFSDDE